MKIVEYFLSDLCNDNLKSAQLQNFAHDNTNKFK